MTKAGLSRANLTGADLGFAVLSNADLAGAVVAGAELGSTNDKGFTKQQLYSTASYQAKNLREIRLSHSSVALYPGLDNDLAGWNLAGQNLTGAYLAGATLASANLDGANVSHADLGYTTPKGFAKEQIYSTASYKDKDLTGITLWFNDLSGWNFSGQNLVGANFLRAKLVDADFDGGLIRQANFEGGSADDFGLSKEQLYSTASYKARDLRNIQLTFSNYSGWDFSGQDLTGASFAVSPIAEDDLTGAIVAGADLAFTGITKEQLYSTASYLAKDLCEIRLSGRGHQLERTDLSGWDFSGQDLSSAVLHAARLNNADLKGATLANAMLEESVLTGADLTGADLRGARGLPGGGLRRNTILPDGTVRGFDLAAGETVLMRDDDALLRPPSHGWGSPRPAIPVRIVDHMAMGEGSKLSVQFEADAWNSRISFEPGIPVRLGGMLELAFADDVDVAAQVGRMFELFDWTGVSPTGRPTAHQPTAKANQIEPFAYVRDLLTQLSGCSPSTVGALLPDAWLVAHPEYRRR